MHVLSQPYSYLNLWCFFDEPDAWYDIAAVQVPYRWQWAVAYQAPDAQRRQAQHGVAPPIGKPFIEMSADEHVGALWKNMKGQEKNMACTAWSFHSIQIPSIHQISFTSTSSTSLFPVSFVFWICPTIRVPSNPRSWSFPYQHLSTLCNIGYWTGILSIPYSPLFGLSHLIHFRSSSKVHRTSLGPCWCATCCHAWSMRRYVQRVPRQRTYRWVKMLILMPPMYEKL